MSEVDKSILEKQLLDRLRSVQKLGMNLLALAGISCFANLLQNAFYTPRPWIMLFFLAFMGLFYLNRIRVKRLKWELAQIGCRW